LIESKAQTRINLYINAILGISVVHVASFGYMIFGVDWLGKFFRRSLTPPYLMPVPLPSHPHPIPSHPIPSHSFALIVSLPFPSSPLLYNYNRMGYNRANYIYYLVLHGFIGNEILLKV